MNDIEIVPSLRNVNISEVLSRHEASYPIEVIDDPQSPRIQEAVAIDELAFGKDAALSSEAFQNIIKHGGAVFGHVNTSGQLISEASLILEPDHENGKTSLEQNLPTWLAYCDGAAVVDEYRGKGLERELLTARELIAHEGGKTASSTSVRHGNLASLTSMLGNGYIIVADAPKYFGDEATDDRLVLMKPFEYGNPLEQLSSDHEGLNPSYKGLTELSEVDTKITTSSDVISIAGRQTNEIDQVYNDAISKLLRSGYVGVACHDLDIGDSDGERISAVIFVKAASLTAIGTHLAEKQQELQTILDKGRPQGVVASPLAEVESVLNSVASAEQERQEFLDSLVSAGLISEQLAKSKAMDKFGIDPDTGGSALKHILIGDSDGGAHHARSVMDLGVTDRTIASVIHDPERPHKKLADFRKAQQMRPDGSYKSLHVVIGDDLEKVTGSNMFPDRWSTEEVITHILEVSDLPGEYSAETECITHVATIDGTKFKVITDAKSGDIISAFPSR